MRIVFHNLHCNNLIARPLFFFLTGRPCTYKHLFLLKYLIAEKKKYAVYIDGEMSSFPSIISRIIPVCVEFFLWAIFNKINPFKIDIIRNINKLNDDDLWFSYLWLVPSEESFKKIKATKVIHLTHFMHGIEGYSETWKKLGVDYFVSENDLHKNSPFFKKYFSWYDKPIYILPHVWKERFNNSVPFVQRKNKAIATGTTFRFEDKAFNSFFKVFYYHPMRQMIYDNAESMKEYIDSFISEYYEDKKPKEIKASDNVISKIYKNIYNIITIGKQSQYHSFDIVKKYNEYKMSVVPEEVNNLPGIGFVESIACGCVYIGLDDPMYRDIGLIPGKHYLAYDGTLEGLQDVIGYYQAHPVELNAIANNGFNFVRANFNEKNVAELFYNDLESIVNNKKADCIIKSSFLKNK